MNWDDLAVAIMFKICLCMAVLFVISSLYFLGAIIHFITATF